MRIGINSDKLKVPCWRSHVQNTQTQKKNSINEKPPQSYWRALWTSVQKLQFESTAMKEQLRATQSH